MEDIEDIDMNSEEEYTASERKLLDKLRNRHTIDNYDSEEEVYKLQDSEEEEEDEDDQQDSLESDIEELQEEHGMPSDRAWGSKARTFYSSDFKYTDFANAPQKDLADASIEEEEGRKLHVRLLEQFSDVGGLDIENSFIQTTESDERRKDGEVSVQEIDEKVFMALINNFRRTCVPKINCTKKGKISLFKLIIEMLIF